jgi:hypothetical protein
MPKRSQFSAILADSRYLANSRAVASIDPQSAIAPDIDLMAGGEWFVEALLKYGVNERKEPLRINFALLDFARLVGDCRFKMVASTGAAQVFKSVVMWQFAAALLTIAKRDFMWVYPQMTMIADLVPTQFKPIIGEWESALNLDRKANSADSKSQQIHQSVHGTGRFKAASNPSASRKKDEGTAIASARNVSASVDILIFDETSQVPAPLLEPFDRRTLQSRIPTAPKRPTGTPGGGAGIERQVKLARWDFYPHTKCVGCEEISALSPLGWLLKPDEENKYFDEAGTPRHAEGICHWHYHDPADPIESAYFGCPNCGTEIALDRRLNHSWFQCLKSGDRLRDVLDNLPAGVPSTTLTAGITLSPLLRDSVRNEAAEIIRKGLSTGNAIDWQQQEIGIATTLSNNGISIEMIRAATNCPVLDRAVDYKLWGLDQGTTEHWLVGVNYRLPVDSGLNPIERYRLAHREFCIIRPVTSIDMESGMLSSFDGGCLDNEPGRDWAKKISDTYQGCLMADQRGGKELGGKIQALGSVDAGGVPCGVMLVDTHQIQNYILGFFSSKKGLVSLPRSVNPDDLTPNSFARHLTTSIRDPELGRWTRPRDHKDDYLKAIVFCELAFYCRVMGVQMPTKAFDTSKISSF